MSNDEEPENPPEPPAARPKGRRSNPDYINAVAEVLRDAGAGVLVQDIDHLITEPEFDSDPLYIVNRLGLMTEFHEDTLLDLLAALNDASVEHSPFEAVVKEPGERDNNEPVFAGLGPSPIVSAALTLDVDKQNPLDDLPEPAFSDDAIRGLSPGSPKPEPPDDMSVVEPFVVPTERPSDPVYVPYDLAKATPAQAKALGIAIVAGHRRTQAQAVALGLHLRGKFAELGKGKYGDYEVEIGIRKPLGTGSTGNLYRNLAKKWEDLVGTYPQQPKCTCEMQVVGLDIGGLSAESEIPIPTKWKDRTLNQIAHNRDPDEQPKPLGQVIKETWNANLNPTKFVTDLLKPECPPDLAVEVADRARTIYDAVSARMSDQGRWNKVREEAVTYLRTLDRRLKQSGVPGGVRELVDEIDPVPDPPTDGGSDSPDPYAFGSSEVSPPSTPQEAAAREADRLREAAMPPPKPPTTKEAILAVYETMDGPMTAQMIAERAFGGDTCRGQLGHLLASVYSTLRGKERWDVNSTYYKPPGWCIDDSVHVDEQKEIAANRGYWIPPKPRPQQMPSVAPVLGPRGRKFRGESKSVTSAGWLAVGDRLIVDGKPCIVSDISVPADRRFGRTGEAAVVDDNGNRVLDGKVGVVIIRSTYGTRWTFADDDVLYRRMKSTWWDR